MNVMFSTWHVIFSLNNEESIVLLQYPLWVQFLGLSQYLKNETCFRIIVGKIGKVLQVKLSNTYLSNIASPWVRLLVGDIENILEKIVN
jgi:hypothetical protein